MGKLQVDLSRWKQMKEEREKTPPPGSAGKAPPGRQNAPSWAVYTGKWKTEEGFPFLTIEEGKVTLIYMDERDLRQTLESPAVLTSDGALVPPEGAERLGFYSTIRRDGIFLRATDALTGEEDVFALDRDDFKPGSMAEFEGTWLTRDGALKLVIGGGTVTSYSKDKTGRYARSGEGRAAFNEGRRDLAPANGRELAGYTGIEKRGKLLYAHIFLLDAPAQYDIFAKEGHAEDFPPETVCIRTAGEVADPRLRSFKLSVRCFDGGNQGGTLSDLLPGMENAVSLELRMNASRLTGERLILGNIRGREVQRAPSMGMMGMGAPSGDTVLRQTSLPVTEELERKLAALLLTEGILKRNPLRDHSDMMCPTVYVTLEASFASGESILFDTRYGLPAETWEALRPVAALLLGGS